MPSSSLARLHCCFQRLHHRITARDNKTPLGPGMLFVCGRVQQLQVCTGQVIFTHAERLSESSKRSSAAGCYPSSLVTPPSSRPTVACLHCPYCTAVLSAHLPPLPPLSLARPTSSLHRPHLLHHPSSALNTMSCLRCAAARGRVRVRVVGVEVGI